ncbi:AMIN domain-containing protein, partial [Xanthomonas translucens]
MNRREWLGMAGTALLLAPAWARAGSAPRLTGGSLETDDGRLRLRLQLDATVDYRVFALSDPERLVIDLPGIAAPAPPILLPAPDAVVAAIRSGAQADGLRIVLDLRRPVTASAHWDADAGVSPRLLLDLGPVDAAVAAP